MKKILIIGATSAIAEKCSEIWANRNNEIFLVGRNQEKLNLVKKKLHDISNKNIHTLSCDLNDFQNHNHILNQAEKALGQIDIVLIAHGQMLDQLQCEKDVNLTLEEIKTNALSTISLLTHISNIFEKRKFGTIAVISSVAGDRGKRRNYIYSSAKAMITVFTSGLRQRLYKSNVTLVTIKPGFVSTPMTKNFKKGFLWSKPEKIAKIIVNAIDNKKLIVYAPAYWKIIMIIIKIIPERIFLKLNL